jgi:hypothetical protein
MIFQYLMECSLKWLIDWLIDWLSLFPPYLKSYIL